VHRANADENDISTFFHIDVDPHNIGEQELLVQ
jgi:hypothetical protein